jgi:eukaryotic-like serine/threonine-protein kinase
MVSLLNERPRTGSSATDPGDSGWLRKLRERRPEDAPAATASAPPTAAAPAVGAQPSPPTVTVETVRQDPHTFPPLPPVPPPSGDRRGSWADGLDDDLDSVLVPDDGPGYDGYDDYPDDDGAGADETEEPDARRRLLVIGLPVLALAVVIALAWWFGTNVLSVAGSVGDVTGSAPSAGTSAGAGTSSAAASAPSSAAGRAATIVSGRVFDPEGDGEPENDKDVPLSYDGDPSTSWSTLQYRGSPDFGHLKSGVGIVYDLGSAQSLSGVSVTTTTPGATVEIRTGDNGDGDLDSFAVAASGKLDATSDLTFASPVTARFVLVWVTGLVEGGDGYSADLSEVAVHAAG